MGPDDMTENEPAPGCPISSDAVRSRQVEQTHGQPRTEFPAGHTPYAAYAQMHELLDLQRPRTGALTEPGFIIMSQVMELLFKLLHVEFTAACDQLRGDRIDDVVWTLRRSSRVQSVLLSSWDVLAALTPGEFAEFRDELGSASGFQSVSYRLLEFLLGNKNPKMVAPHRNSPAHEQVLAQLHRPSLWDEVLAALGRAGLDVPAQVLARDVALPYQPDEAVEGAWRTIYREPGRYREFHLLGETLMDTADLFARWRYTHLVTVQRLLGGKPGSGGTNGVSWLRNISDHRFFPELWSMRSGL